MRRDEIMLKKRLKRAILTRFRLNLMPDTLHYPLLETARIADPLQSSFGCRVQTGTILKYSG
jgi:hypothetical protein